MYQKFLRSCCRALQYACVPQLFLGSLLGTRQQQSQKSLRKFTQASSPLVFNVANNQNTCLLLSIEMFCFICVYHLYQLTETIQLLAEDILERRQETTRLHRCLCKLAGKVTNVFFRLYELQSTLCKKDICRTGTKCLY